MLGESNIQLLSKDKDSIELNLNNVNINYFDNVHLIPNSNYFYLNPDHGDNNGSINSEGTCTTVAMELLMGYHNYYSDRRLIPHINNSSDKFLIDYYGDIAYHPSIYYGNPAPIVSDYFALYDTNGNPTKLVSAAIGTADAFYYELIELTTWAEFPSIGQNLIALKNAANKFVERYSFADEVNINYSIYSKSNVISELNAGRPVVLGYEPVFSGADSFHVVVAYGYATYNGSEGYIVHYGWGEDKTQIWVPESWFGYQVTMNVAHTHSMLDTGESYDFSYKIYECSICGYKEPICYYTFDTTGSIITGTNFTLNGDIQIPNTIKGHTITAIGNAAFANQGNLTSITIPDSVTNIGANAFENCCSAESITITTDSQLTSIGNSAFRGCSSLAAALVPAGVTWLGANTFENCSSLSAVLVYASLTNIGNAAFRNCSSLEIFALPESLNVIGYNAFENCQALELESLPAQLERIENAAFSGCTGLENLHLPAGLEHIGYDVFNSCSGLETLLIPDTVTSVGGNAFANCYYLTVFAERQSAPSGWISNWNPSGRPVLWGCGFDADSKYVTSFFKSDSTISNINAVNGINNPYYKGNDFAGWYTNADYSGTVYGSITEAPEGLLYAKWQLSSCVTPGTMITLADGSTKAVEDLTGNEMLLVWNMFTGEFDSAPILFIDSDSAAYCEVITLTFSDGTEVEVIDEHGFWNIDLNEYVFLRADAAQYIGDMFNKQSFDENGNMIYTAVELIGVETETVYTTAWSPVTQGHLCYYVNGMLSMPGATTGLINIFEVDAETMTIDEEAFEEDINTYGIFTYEEFCDEIAYIPEAVFQAFGGVYLKVALGKGILTTEMLEELIIRYSVFWETED